MSSLDINSPVNLITQGSTKLVELHSCKTTAVQWGIRHRLLIHTNAGKSRSLKLIKIKGISLNYV